MKFSKEWQDYIDSLNACCKAAHLTALHTRACVLYANAVVKEVNKVAQELYKIEDKLGQTKDYYRQYLKGASLAILVRPVSI